jgi:hypothetical protein
MRHAHHCLPLVLLLAACGGRGEGGSVACGLAAMNGPLITLEGFARGDALASAPANLPLTLPGRFVAGPSGPVRLAVGDSGRLRAAFEVPPPERSLPGYGVVVLDRTGVPMGVLVYDGAPIPGAIGLGTIEVGTDALPLYGVRVTRNAVETAACPLIPNASP